MIQLNEADFDDDVPFNDAKTVVKAEPITPVKPKVKEETMYDMINTSDITCSLNSVDIKCCLLSVVQFCHFINALY